MKKVIVIGSPGAGKSTFSRKLAEVRGLPLYYLDMLWHKPDRTTRHDVDFDRRLAKIIHRESWIMDGNYPRTLERRLKKCDTVYFLDYPLEVCLSGVESRIGKKREDMPWIETEFDPEFKQWIIDFAQDQLPIIYQLLDQYKEEKNIFIFKSREEAAEYLDTELKPSN